MKINPALVLVVGTRSTELEVVDPNGWPMCYPGPAEILIRPLGPSPRAEAHARKVFDYVVAQAGTMDKVRLEMRGKATAGKRKRGGK